MAELKGSGGTIVINEQEAAADINSIESAAAKLAEARALLAPSRVSDAGMIGDARSALDAKLAEFCKLLEGFESRCGGTNKFIGETVAKYQRIDRELSGKVQG
ncbi:MAG: hypothetical protein LBQ36_03810 [Synergistaceae bacterium]|jgi:hypothetical protein|nr:hypothetical protein [Synergistaceae bacterium]